MRKTFAYHAALCAGGAVALVGMVGWFVMVINATTLLWPHNRLLAAGAALAFSLAAMEVAVSLLWTHRALRRWRFTTSGDG